MFSLSLNPYFLFPLSESEHAALYAAATAATAAAAGRRLRRVPQCHGRRSSGKHLLLASPRQPNHSSCSLLLLIFPRLVFNKWGGGGAAFFGFLVSFPSFSLYDLSNEIFVIASV